MNPAEYEKVEDRAVRVSDLVEQLIELDALLDLHRQHDAHPADTRQYLDRKTELLQELNALLHPYRLRLVQDDQIA